MRNKQLVALAALLCLATVDALAQGIGGARKWYVGLDVGQSKLDREATIWEFAELDDTSTAFTARVGYRFSRYFALEGGYTDLGDFDATLNLACIPESPCPSFGISTSIDGFLANAVGIWPIAEHFELSASAGLIYREFEARTTTSPSTFPSTSSATFISSSASDTDTVMKFGIGIGVPINNQWEIGLDVTQYREIGLGFTSQANDVSVIKEGESTVVSLGFRWKF
jgi:OmpA-OmpF porin, OOP family